MEQGKSGDVVLARDEPGTTATGGSIISKAAMWASRRDRASERSGFCLAVWR